jgi:hypothetical protein
MLRSSNYGGIWNRCAGYVEFTVHDTVWSEDELTGYMVDEQSVAIYTGGR